MSRVRKLLSSVATQTTSVPSTSTSTRSTPTSDKKLWDFPTPIASLAELSLSPKKSFPLLSHPIAIGKLTNSHTTSTSMRNIHSMTCPSSRSTFLKQCQQSQLASTNCSIQPLSTATCNMNAHGGVGVNSEISRLSNLSRGGTSTSCETLTSSKNPTILSRYS